MDIKEQIKISIPIHKKTVSVLNVDIGDYVYRPTKRKEKNNSKRDKITDISDGTIWFKIGKMKHGFGNSIILDYNPSLKEYKEQSKNFRLLSEYLKTLSKQVYQIEYIFEKFTDKENPFSLCYITDRKCFSDWTEWNIPYLPNPKEMDFVLKNDYIIAIDNQ